MPQPVLLCSADWTSPPARQQSQFAAKVQGAIQKFPVRPPKPPRRRRGLSRFNAKAQSHSAASRNQSAEPELKIFH